MMSIDARTGDKRESLKQQFVDIRGRWDPHLDAILAADPGYFETYLEFSLAPWKSGTLSPKVRELLYLAVNASITSLNESAVKYHIEAALDCGASQQEILETLELISTVGLHAVLLSLPILKEVAGDSGDVMLPSSGTLTSRQEEIKAEFVRGRGGVWSPNLETILRADPEFLASFIPYGVAAWETGSLEPKIRELIYIAIDATVTHLYAPGIRQHMRFALHQGATPLEILEVLELVAHIGIYAPALGMRVLHDVLAARDRDASGTDDGRAGPASL